MLTRNDIERFDSIMASVTQKRENRGFMIPDRDEEKIAEILRNAERRAAEEHALLLQAKNQMASAIQFIDEYNDYN